MPKMTRRREAEVLALMNAPEPGDAAALHAALRDLGSHYGEVVTGAVTVAAELAVTDPHASRRLRLALAGPGGRVSLGPEDADAQATAAERARLTAPVEGDLVEKFNRDFAGQADMVERIPPLTVALVDDFLHAAILSTEPGDRSGLVQLQGLVMKVIARVGPDLYRVPSLEIVELAILQDLARRADAAQLATARVNTLEELYRLLGLTAQLHVLHGRYAAQLGRIAELEYDLVIALAERDDARRHLRDVLGHVDGAWEDAAEAVQDW